MFGTSFAIGFAIFFGLIVLFIVGIVIFMVATVSRRTRAARAAGLDPLAGDIQVMGAVRDAAQGMAQQSHAQESVADRLQQVDSLLAAGSITNEEHAAMRARILGSV